LTKALRRAPDGKTGLRSGRHRPTIVRQLGPEPDAKRLARSAGEAGLTTLSLDLLYDQTRRGNLTYSKVGRRRRIPAST
jgi:hypothetical protein